jgi:hypothetical protein
MTMTEEFAQILDRCIDRLNAGETLEACLADYPQDADQLRPLLQAMSQTREAYAFTPSASAKATARQRFTAAWQRLEEKRQAKQPWFVRAFTRPATWATVAAVLVVAIVTFVVVRPVLSPVLPITPTPSPQGNFVFLISDEVNAIGDFTSLTVTISKIGLQQKDSGKWVEFKPEVAEVDLTKVQGDAVQKVWQGDIPEGQYKQVFIYVDNVSGVLKATKQTEEVKLPSHKLHITKSFQISADTITSFTYDLTVVAAGNQQSGIKYILKPQADQSGASQSPSEDKEKGTSDNRTKPSSPPTNLPTPESKPPKKEK